MDLIPKPGQVAAAASNVAHKVLYGGIADLRPMPRTLIDDGPLREVYHYRPHKQVRPTGDPVLLVTPLAAPALCFDLRRGCSLVEHFVQEGRPTYLVEYGEVSFSNRNLGMEHWVDEVIPEAIRTVSTHAGGRPVHVIGWSVGGIFATLVAADQPELPIASLTAVGSPFDVTQVPLIAPLRPILRLTDGGLITQAYRMLGGAPKPLVRLAFQLSSGTKLVTKPVATLQHLDDAEWLAQIEAVDRFTDNMIAYPGRSFGQLYHRLIKHNMLVHGKVRLGDREIRIADITAPVLIFAGNTDGIAPIGAVKALVGLLKNAYEVRFEIVPGGHLGMLTGRAARTTTWLVMDEWIDQHSTPDSRPGEGRRTTSPRSTRKGTAEVTDLGAAKRPVGLRSGGERPTARKTAKQPAGKKASSKQSPAKQTPTKKSAAKQAPATKTPAKKATAKKSTTRKSAPNRAAIGANPERRYDSSSSRGLATPKK